MGKTYVFIPPIRKTTGGVAVLLQLVGILRSGGVEAILALREAGRAPDEAGELPSVAFDQANPGPEDVWLVPEGWPNALAPGLSGKARCMVYCQNWAYFFNGLPENVSWKNLPVSFIAVSHPVSLFIETALGTAPPILRPGIDLGHFHPPMAKPTASPVRVAYMPRKNKALAEQIKAMTESRRSVTGVAAEWVPIEHLDRDGVAETLRSCHIFLATGYPEGFSLPPLEAMACGCLPVGFTGFGGWDYMRQARTGDPEPSFPLRSVPWGGNGMYAHDGDVLAAALALDEALRWWAKGGRRLEAALAACRETVSHYGLDRQREAVMALWKGVLGENRTQTAGGVNGPA